MSIDGIKITLGEVSKTAGNIRTINKSLNDALTQIKNEMNSLAANWQSDASSTIREKFNGLVPRFEEYREVVESYALFLDKTVERYNETETVINSNASSFK